MGRKHKFKVGDRVVRFAREEERFNGFSSPFKKVHIPFKRGVVVSNYLYKKEGNWELYKFDVMLDIADLSEDGTEKVEDYGFQESELTDFEYKTDHWELEEIYNSPLYKALQEDHD